MRINEFVNEGPVWDKVKTGVKKFFTPKKLKSPLETVNTRELKQVLELILNKKELSQQQLLFLKDIYNKLR